jgi:YidC/Oxa1 family membrane protein insertase
MEKFDKNYIIGFVLLFLMYGTYMYFNPGTPATPETTQQKSTAKASPSTAKSAATLTQDTLKLKSQFGDFASAAVGTEQEVTVENEDAIIVFSSKGGAIKKITLKNYQTFGDYTKKTGNPMVILDEENSEMKLEVQTPKGKIDLKGLYYQTSAVSGKVNGEGKYEVKYSVSLGDGKSVDQVYTVGGKGFSIDYDLKFNNTHGLISDQPVSFYWKDKLKVLENDLAENQKAAQVNYLDSEDNFEDVGFGSVDNEEEKAELPVKWFAYKQKYFVGGFVSKNAPFQNASFTLTTPVGDSTTVKIAEAKVELPYKNIIEGKGNFRFYAGPNDYEEVLKVADGFHKNVYLGYDIVKPINRFVFVPLFEWVESFITNYGLLIILVVLIIKTALTPLIYKSYVSSAKMRLLAPEINEIKERVGDDQVKVQQETMKLYQQVGVSPLSGCVPLLLQMPILMSVFFLFPNMIMFRQKTFLWANDLSTYDAPISWATHLPVIGNHISLFVVLMTLSSLAFTYYNNQITPAQPGPIDMKKISYIFPLVFFFVLNSFPAALSFYYLVSNLVTIGQQLIVRKFIDEDKIRAVLENNKKTYHTKPQKRNKFGEYLQKQLQASEEMKKQSEDLKKKSKKK